MPLAKERRPEGHEQQVAWLVGELTLQAYPLQLTIINYCHVLSMLSLSAVTLKV